MAGTIYRHRLNKNHVTILRDLEPGKVLPYLFQEEIFDVDDLDEVRAEKTRKKKAQMLLEKLQRCGQDGVSVFVDALRNTQPHLANILETPIPGEDQRVFSTQIIDQEMQNLVVCVGPALNLNANSPVEHNNLSKTVPLTHVGSTDKGAALRISTEDQYWVKPIEPRLLEELDSDSVYPMKCNPHGFAILININKFVPSPVLEERLGSNKDVEVLERLFQSLGYIVQSPTQLTKSGILKELQRIVGEIECSLKDDSAITHDSTVVFLMSHGEDDFIFCADGEKLAVDEVRKLFNNDNCSALAGKPKLIFVQACRGKQRDQGLVCRDGPGERTDEPLGMEVLQGERRLVFDAVKKTMPSDADVVVAFSSVSGHTSFRNTGDGSRFVQKLVEVFREEAGRQDLLSMLTMVNNEVSNLGDFGTKQVPAPVTTLRKKVYFWPGLHNSH